MRERERERIIYDDVGTIARIKINIGREVRGLLEGREIERERAIVVDNRRGGGNQRIKVKGRVRRVSLFGCT